MAHRPREPFLAPPPQGLPVDPLAFLRAEHHRQRQVCRLIDVLAAARRPGRRMARAAHAYLAGPLEAHMRDEEEELFPLLRRRCPPEDEVDRLLEQLHRDHRANAELGAGIDDVLAALAIGQRCGDREAFTAAARCFTAALATHLAFENGILLPLARRRLGRGDQRRLGHRLALRRRQTAPARD